jgi:peptidoglycan L-alanyl-D-glutamate endopeptidase CwlK
MSAWRQSVAYRLSKRSRDRLKGVHPDLVRVVNRAITLTPVDFSVVEGVRTLAKQREYFIKGKSRTMNSRHLTGHAVDLAPWIDGTIDWSDGLHWKDLSLAVKAAALAEGVPVEWGYDLWRWDQPHWQLPRQAYPA